MQLVPCSASRKDAILACIQHPTLGCSEQGSLDLSLAVPPSARALRKFVTHPLISQDSQHQAQTPPAIGMKAEPEQEAWSDAHCSGMDSAPASPDACACSSTSSSCSSNSLNSTPRALSSWYEPRSAIRPCIILLVIKKCPADNVTICRSHTCAC